MPVQHLLCQVCEGTGFTGKDLCTCCLGYPKIDFYHYCAAMARVEDLTLRLKQLHSETRGMRRQLRNRDRSPKVVEIRELTRLFQIEPPEAA